MASGSLIQMKLAVKLLGSEVTQRSCVGNNDMFKDMVTEAKELIGAEHTGLFLVVDDETETSPKIYNRREKRREGYLCCKHIDGTDNHAHVPIGDGVLSSSALSGKIVNVSK